MTIVRNLMKQSFGLSGMKQAALCLTLLLTVMLCGDYVLAQPAVSTQDTTLDYGTVQVNSGFRKVVRVRNNTNQSLTAQVSLPADASAAGFSVEGSASRTVGPNQTININVRFDARSAAGNIQRFLTISAGGTTLTITLRANAIAAIVTHGFNLRNIGGVGGGRLTATSALNGGRAEISCEIDAAAANNDTCAQVGGRFQSGDTVTISASGNFLGWKNGRGSATACNGNANPCSFKITADSEIFAEFPSLKKFRINLEKLGNGAGTIEAVFGAGNILASVGPENGSRSGEMLQERLIRVSIKPAFGSKVTALEVKGTSTGSGCEASNTGCTFTARSDASFRVTFSRNK